LQQGPWAIVIATPEVTETTVAVGDAAAIRVSLGADS